MATDALSERLSSKLHLQTKTVGEERIRRAKENDEDVAILSMFPMEGDTKFRCYLGKDCLLGDQKLAKPGDCYWNMLFYILFCTVDIAIIDRERTMIVGREGILCL